MKMLFVSDVSLLNPSSGSEQVLYQQAIGLSSIFENISAITRRNGKSALIENNYFSGIKEIRYFCSTENIFRFFYTIFKNPPKIFNRLQYDQPFSAIISHQPYTCLSLLLMGKIQKTQMIYVFHSPNHEEYLISRKNANCINRYVQGQIRKLIERYCLKRSKKIVVLSEYMQQKVMEIHQISKKRIIVNPGGVDLDRFYPVNNRSQVKEEINLPPRKPHLLTVRNFEARMGLDNLIRAIYLLRENGSNVHLTIGGEGPERKTLDHIVSDYGLSNHISLTGFIPAERLPQYYAAADFFILPTRKLEGFGLVTTESMACGTPVLGTPVGGTLEILSGFDSQFLFKDATPEAMAEGIAWAMDNWFNDEERYAWLRGRCREYAEKNYSWQRHVDQLKSIIDELVAVKGELN